MTRYTSLGRTEQRDRKALATRESSRQNTTYKQSAELKAQPLEIIFKS
jgi:hypothetical protein